MVAYGGWRSAFYVTACGPALGTGLMFWVLRSTPPSISSSPDASTHDGLWHALLTNKDAMLMIWGYAFHSWELLGMRAWFPTFLTTSVALVTTSGPQAVSIGASVGAMLSWASMVGNIGGGALSDRWGRTTVIVLMSTFSLTCSFTIGWLVTLPLWLIILVGACYSIAAIGDSPVYSAALTELVPLRFLAAVYALRSVLGFGAGVLSPLAFGFVLDWARNALGAAAPQAWGLAFASLGLGGIFGPLGMLWLRKRPHSAPMPEEFR
jgi:MFS family permease